MARLRFNNQVPPGGFKFRQKESALIIEGESLGDLTDKVIAHRLHKGFAPTDRESVGLEVERQICGRLGVQLCRAEGFDDEWVPVPENSDVFDLDKIKRFSHAAWEWFKGGGAFVTPEEANRRREICAACPANADTGKDCFNCTLGKLIRFAVPDERRFPELKVCAFCGCDLQSKVNVPETVIVASDVGRGIAYPAHCWQKEILDKHKSLPSA